MALCKPENGWSGCSNVASLNVLQNAPDGRGSSATPLLNPPAGRPPALRAYGHPIVGTDLHPGGKGDASSCQGDAPAVWGGMGQGCRARATYRSRRWPGTASGATAPRLHRHLLITLSAVMSLVITESLVVVTVITGWAISARRV